MVVGAGVASRVVVVSREAAAASVAVALRGVGRSPRADSDRGHILTKSGQPVIRADGTGGSPRQDLITKCDAGTVSIVAIGRGSHPLHCSASTTLMDPASGIRAWGGMTHPAGHSDPAEDLRLGENPIRRGIGLSRGVGPDLAEQWA